MELDFDEIRRLVKEGYISARKHGGNRGSFKLLYPVNDSFFDFIGEEQAWLLGLLAADGCVENDRHISLSQSSEGGLRLLQEIQKMLGHKGNLSNYKNSFTLAFTSPRIVERLAHFNIIPRKSLIYRFPELLPAERHASFIRGYIEGDGSTGIYRIGNSSAVPIISFVGTRAFIDSCVQIIPTPGTLRHIKQAQNLKELRYVGQKALNFSRWVWTNNDLPVTRKQRIITDFFDKYRPQYVVEAEQRKRAIELLNIGLRPEKIAHRLGIAWQTVYVWRKKYGTPSGN